MPSCRICGSPVAPFMSFGRMPIANAFISKCQPVSMPCYELSPAVCPNCQMFQLVERPPPDAMFRANYPYSTGTSTRMLEHFAAAADACLDMLRAQSDPFVVEIGSNDGSFLRHVGNAGVRHLGIDPAADVAAAAERAGVTTLVGFFNEETAHAVRDRHGPADIIYAANVMAHIADFPSVARGLHHLLKAGGRFVFENIYLASVLEEGAFDQIYDEHVFTFSVTSVQRAFSLFGLNVIDVEPIWTHGGSMRFTLVAGNETDMSDAAARALEREAAVGLTSSRRLDSFRRHCERTREDLRALIAEQRSQGHRIVGYGATAKSTTVLNYCGLSPAEVDYIADTTPAKANTRAPGSGIPVVPAEHWRSDGVDRTVLFAWNHAREIMAREAAYMKRSGRWLHYMPKVRLA